MALDDAHSIASTVQQTELLDLRMISCRLTNGMLVVIVNASPGSRLRSLDLDANKMAIKSRLQSELFCFNRD